MGPQATSEAITFDPIKIQTHKAPQNDRQKLSFVKDTHTVKQMARNGRTKVIYKETFVSEWSLVLLHIFTLPPQNNTFVKICNTVYAGIKLANRFVSNSEHNIYTTGSKGVRILLYRVYLGTQHIGPRPTGSFCSTALCIRVRMQVQF